MKIKMDFVTNSSSTSYILSGFCYGSISCRISDDMKKFFEEVLSAEFQKSDSIYKDYIRLKTYLEMNSEEKVVIVDESEEYTTGEVELEITVQDIGEFPEDETVHTFVNIEYKSPILSIESNTAFIEFVRDILQKVLDKSSKPIFDVKFVYTQVPIEMWGDGWYNPDGPQMGGPYNFPYDMLLRETQKGYFEIDKNKKLFFTLY